MNLCIKFHFYLPLSKEEIEEEIEEAEKRIDTVLVYMLNENKKSRTTSLLNEDGEHIGDVFYTKK